MKRIFLLAIVFISSFCLMVIELVAGRLMAPYLGVSLFTWTSIIGVILAGISLGNYVGGKIADSFGSREVLGGILFLSGFTSLLVRFMVPFFGGLLQGSSLPLYLSTLVFSFFVFFPVSLFLGCISPIIVKLDLRALSKTGNTVGRIYAFGTLGSILGTFVTGYFLISLAGTKIIVLVVGLILLLLGVLVLGASLKFWKPGALVVFLFVAGLLLPDECLRETNYYCINVKFVGKSSQTFQLKLDHLVHSYIDLDNAARLEYNYEKVYSILVDYFAEEKENFSNFFLGGGGYTMPRYLENNYPLSSIEVAEIDPGVTEINYEKLGLSRDTKIFTANQDARIYLQNFPADKKYDLIFGDAFNDYAVPYHLTTREFNELINSHLSDNGFYAVNIIDDYNYGRFVSSYIKTMKEVFPYVYLAPLSRDWKNGGRNTFVVIAGKEELDMLRWSETLPENIFDDNETLASNLHFLVSDDELDSFLGSRKTVFLTDDYVPIDNLLAPVFVDGY